MILNNRLFRFCIILIAGVYLLYLALIASTLHAPPADPFYITPAIQGNDLLDSEKNYRLTQLLNNLEPGGAHGKVQLGYSFAFNLYDYFQQKQGKWVVNTKQIDNVIARMIALHRPVTVGLIANHFAGSGEYAQVLLKDPDATMRYADGTIPNEQYFRTKLAPFTISNDTKYPHVKALQEVLGVMATAFAKLEKTHPNLVVGYVFNGETHYLFEDFFGGTGRFETARFTDFSNSALSEFRSYLAAHPDPAIAESPESIRSLNVAAYEWGTYPLFGWYCPAAANQHLTLLRDGVEVAQTVPSLNRLDVVETLPEMHNPNCGFRFDVDFSTWKDGTYHLQVAVDTDNGRYALENGHVVLRIGNGGVTKPSNVSLPALPLALGRGYLDKGSATAIQVHYRPLARAWVEYRAAAIVAHVDWMAEPFRNVDIAANKLYNYQLPPWMNGDWNEVQFGIARDYYKRSKLMSGVTLYGGNTQSDAVLGYLRVGTPYGIPEFHIQMDKNKGAALSAMRYHWQHGAQFLSPYFMNIDDKKRSASAHDLMVISPTNHQRGSDDMYDAIKAIVKE